VAIGSLAELASSLSVTELLAPFRADPPGAAVFSDFDGTLAPIVDDPAAARPLDGVVDVLSELARRYGLVGVVSGRPAAFLREHLGGRGLLLSGLYGLELVTEDGDVEAVPEAAEWEPVVRSLAAAGLPPGLSLERKGLTAVVHFRTDPSQARAAEAWAAEAARATGLVVHPGRMSYELRPPLAFDKGTVLAGAVEGRRHVCFFGDDAGDLSAFDALDRMATEGATVVKVGVQSEEAPAALLESADLVVEGPAGTLSVLRDLLGPSGPLSGMTGPSGPLSGPLSGGAGGREGL
jgi:trehalose 6-phosphate phosphatase